MAKRGDVVNSLSSIITHEEAKSKKKGHRRNKSLENEARLENVSTMKKEKKEKDKGEKVDNNSAIFSVLSPPPKKNYISSSSIMKALYQLHRNFGSD
jgi:hypothetical protein